MYPEPGRSRLPYLLAKKKIKATDLARDVDISDGFISQVISGKRFFSYPVAARVAKRLGCTMEELHEWD
ncbi:Cro/C1-type HTH DNA-binding domain-containing protein [Paenibacillus sp. RU5A]|nr:Cro/C1-type HTH DNA-binding domain-containing protein [Paenibacillus sp. RU5A]SOC76709.1 Cro/C1-type HTH DNA-binding domain-containing protein [Paenibacillus sp. RU26A]SOC78100.1 Cro/C1-type HTH DNA-binding domain-containing protein [Paenibacillus sp. RU5M]